jgi:hypothetical protein
LGQDQLASDNADQFAKEQYEARLSRVKRNQSVAKTVGGVVAGTGLLQVGKEVAKNPIP